MFDSHFDNHRELALFLHRLYDENRANAADNLIKSAAPNASELSTKKLNFAQALEKASHMDDGVLNGIQPLLTASSSVVPVSSSTREASVELSQAALMDSAMLKLLNHSIKQSKVVLDNFRVLG